MACNDFVTKSPWIIMQTEGSTVEPFVRDNVVRISEPSEGCYTLEVFEGPTLAGTYPGFLCADSRLGGKAEDNYLLLTIVTGPGRAQISGQWNPTQQTTGTWTGDEGGGGGGSDEA